MAQDREGEFLLRIEDIDQSRARQSWEDQIYEDLEWLGLSWPHPVMRQSQRQTAYDQALDRLWEQGLLFACSCNRRDIIEAASAPQEGAPLLGPDGIVYPGTCQPNSGDFEIDTQRPTDVALRLNIHAAAQQIGLTRALSFQEFRDGSAETPETIEFTMDDVVSSIGSVVLARKDMGTSYHLSVVVDDADQNITDVVRGKDLFEATRIHVVLQHLLDLPTPRYHHHRLIRDETGKRLAKRDDARAISKYRSDGVTPEQIRRMVGIP